VSELAAKAEKLTDLLTRLCSTPDEAFKVLGHVTVALLRHIIETRGLKPPADEQLVAQYLLEVAAGMERFGGPTVFGVASAATAQSPSAAAAVEATTPAPKEWIAVGPPVDPQTEKIVRDMIAGDGGTIVDLGDAGRNDPCPCGSGKKYKRCHGAG
jgi:hypothetical protein